ncbi:DoxX family membrane protein [Vogesella sp. DC21W]|uniref:DoxX family membrane protein n=1 Tax=Vogesella aquatica TaxID=2984206 RepID=A0ABT5J355_9NEIS|nr:DoxX family membrane protein [Vogesella aquatica]MDC7718941.1 DoxX family membrane protein [Vogesella aquatica]
MNAIITLLRRSQPATAWLDTWLQPVALLAMRLYLARVFFLSGLTKIQDWDSTVFLFTEEYRVPLLSPALAAALGTAGELLLPPLLLLGLAGRFAALGLFVLNIMAVVSYWHALEGSALEFHLQWGLMLLLLLASGPGKLALDGLIKRRFG